MFWGAGPRPGSAGMFSTAFLEGVLTPESSPLPWGSCSWPRGRVMHTSSGLSEAALATGIRREGWREGVPGSSPVDSTGGCPHCQGPRHQPLPASNGRSEKQGHGMEFRDLGSGPGSATNPPGKFGNTYYLVSPRHCVGYFTLFLKKAFFLFYK